MKIRKKAEKKITERKNGGKGDKRRKKEKGKKYQRTYNMVKYR